jgi:Ca-activated chloride channel family protein
MRRKSVKLLLTALITASVLPTSAALSAERSLVISALDAKKAPVKDLAPADVVVREDGVAREVLRVRPATAPLTIALLVDDSDAASPAISDIRNGLLEFFKALDGKHEIALISFGERPTMLADYTRDRARLEEAAKRVFARPESGAYFLDAVVEAARGLAKREPERPVIVAIVTEGVEFSNQSYQRTLEVLNPSGATLHALVINVPQQGNPALEEMRNRNVVLDEGTRGTGGRRDQLLSSMALPGALRELASELEHQWVVTYSRPESLIPPESVQVEAKREGLTVRARTKLTQAKVTK